MGFFQRKKTILIVEDEADIAESLKARLTLDSFNVVLAANGQDGVAAARKIKPDLIIMDVMMPIVNGLDACAALKSGEDTKRIPILDADRASAYERRGGRVSRRRRRFFEQTVFQRTALEKNRDVAREKNMTVENAGSFDVLLDDAGEVPAVSDRGGTQSRRLRKSRFKTPRTTDGWPGGSSEKISRKPDAKNLVAIMEGKGCARAWSRADRSLRCRTPQLVKSLSFDAAGLHITTGVRYDGNINARATQSVIAANRFADALGETRKNRRRAEQRAKIIECGTDDGGRSRFRSERKKRVVDKTTITEDLLFYADLLANSPARRFRIDAQSLSYSFLKERMLHNTLQNFKTLLKDLTQWAPQAHINQRARACSSRI